MRETLFLIILTFSTCAISQNRIDFDSVTHKYAKEYRIPGLAVGMVTSDTIIYSLYSNESSRITEKSLFQLSSNSKAITSAIAYWMVEKKIITWESRVKDLIGETEGIQPYYLDATLEDLLTHRAMIPAFEDEKSEEWKNMPEGILSSDSKLKFAKYALTLDPVDITKSHHYSNGGYIIAGLMMERATNKTWKVLVQEYMNENDWVAFLGFPDRSGINRTKGHKSNGMKFKSIESTKHVSLGTSFSPAGNLSMNIMDFSTFIQKQLKGLTSNNQQIRENYFKIHYGFEDYGLGWYNGFVGDTEERFSYHGGGLGIYSSLVLLSAGRNIGIVILCNAGGKRVDKMKQELRKVLWENHRSIIN